MVILEAFLQGLGRSGKEEQCPLQSAQCHLYRDPKALGSHLTDGGSGTPHSRDKAPHKRSLRATLMSKIHPHGHKKSAMGIAVQALLFPGN